MTIRASWFALLIALARRIAPVLRRPAVIAGLDRLTGLVFVGYAWRLQNPPDEFFAEHPDYFSEIDGKRVRDHGQLCLTHPDLPGVVADRVIARLKDAPPSAIVSVSQNDWAGWWPPAGRPRTTLD